MLYQTESVRCNKNEHPALFFLCKKLKLTLISNGIFFTAYTCQAQHWQNL